MKQKTIKFMILSVIILSCSSFIGCKQTVVQNNENVIENDNEVNNNEVNNDDDKTDTKEEENITTSELDKNKVFAEYKDLLLNSSGKYQYTGYAEYGFNLSEPIVNSETASIIYNGTMSDGYGEDERGSRDFVIKYNTVVIGKYFKIIESIDNKDYMRDSKNTLNSIIPDYIVIYNNTGVGTHWTQDFKYNDKTYTAETKVVYSDDNTYKLETIVNNIDGFYNKIYKEERTYEKGYGLTSFGNTPNYIDGEEPTDLLFGYTLNK